MSRLPPPGRGQIARAILTAVRKTAAASAAVRALFPELADQQDLRAQFADMRRLASETQARCREMQGERDALRARVAELEETVENYKHSAYERSERD